METIAQRLSSFIDSLGISKNEFARRIGTSSSVISNITSQDVSFRIDILQKIMGKYPTLNIEWLLNGMGDMYTENPIEKPNPNPTQNPTGVKKPNYNSIDFQSLTQKAANELDAIIASQIGTIKFHIDAIYHHLAHLQPGHKSADSLRSELVRMEEFIDSLMGDPIKDEKPQWEKVSADKKIGLVKIFDGFIKEALDKVFELTRDVYSEAISKK